VFYAVGIITNFFASPVFSMFFVISYDTAHNIVSYVAIAMAVSLSIAALAISLVKRRKSVLLLEPEYEPVIDVVDAPGEALVQATSSVDDQKIPSNAEGHGAEQEDELNKQPATQSIDPSTAQAPAELTADKNATTYQEAVLTLNKDKITCPACKKEFSIPVFMLDYTGLKPRLVRHCPYCDQILDLEQETTMEESFVYNPIKTKTE
jgi:uncharacterized Zn-finger protein